ncbi:hypothetical protein Leryth_027566 [Lithospermum erythrorhizon]|nr:hypothetical protein Leryth_027566 [Lithospermum erythrorhizon]
MFLLNPFMCNNLTQCMIHLHISFPLIAPFLLLLLLLLAYIILNPKTRSKKVFLLDFACFKPPQNLIRSKKQALDRASLSGIWPEEVIKFWKVVLERSGVVDPPNPSLEEARGEAEMVIFGAIDNLLAKTGVEVRDIGILIVNCSIFNPVPSLTSMIVNHYKLKHDVASYSLGGMGCTASLWAIGMANQLLQVHHNTYALVVSTENISQNCYLGSDRSKILINCLFRVGGAAMLLSNRPVDRKFSKYQLIHTVTTHNASSDTSYNCIVQEEDKQGFIGVTITKDLLVSAKNAISSNLITLGPLILPFSEKVLFILNIMKRKIGRGKSKKYVPKFNVAVDHFFPHVGGRPVLDELQKVLGFRDEEMEAPRMTLLRFGNISSSTVWYEIAYSEAKGRIKKGDRLWQMAFGSGFKCCSMVWKATRAIEAYEKSNPWSEEIDKFPLLMDSSGQFPYLFEG